MGDDCNPKQWCICCDGLRQNTTVGLRSYDDGDDDSDDSKALHATFDGGGVDTIKHYIT